QQGYGRADRLLHRGARPQIFQRPAMPTAWGFIGYRARDLRAVISDHSVIARSGATEAIQGPRATRDGFASLAMSVMSRRQLHRTGKIPIQLPRAHNTARA